MSYRWIMDRRNRCATTLVWLAALAAGAHAQQSYSFSKLVDGATPWPIDNGVFNLAPAPTAPSYDGKYIVFRDPSIQTDSGSHAAIWSYNTQDQTFRRLVNLTTAVPGSASTFSDLEVANTAPVVRNGTVIFVAHDGGGGSNQGLYSVPAAGGAVTRVANYTTADPSGGVFSVFGPTGSQMGGFSFDGSGVAFQASGSTLTSGVYFARPDGTGVALVADGAHPYTAGTTRVSIFSAPAINGSNIVMFGKDSTNPATSYQGIYLGSPTGNGTVKELVNSTMALPGNPNANSQTRFDEPILAFDGSLVVFRAHDGNSVPVFSGLYSTDLTSGKIARIADVNSTLPGLGKLVSVATSGVAVNQGSVLFKAGDVSGASGLYLWSNGTIARVAGTNDTIGGLLAQGVGEPGPSAMFGSSFAFTVHFAGPNSPALFFATPAASTITVSAVTNSASYGLASIAPGEVVTLFGSGMGPATRADYQWVDNQIPPALAGVRVLVNGIAAPMLYANDQFCAAIVPFGIAGMSHASVQVEYNGNLSPAVIVPVTNTMPGLFTADTSGSGPGAISYPDGSYNDASNPAAPGSTVVLWASGLGPLSTIPADGSVVSATPALPTLQFPVTVTIGGKTASILYQGPAPQAVAGLYQINVAIPDGTPSGPAAVVVTSDGRESQPNVTVAVK